MRGYLVAKEFEKTLIKARMTDHFDYFAEVRQKIEVDAQILIAYHMRKKIKYNYKLFLEAKRRRDQL